MMRLRDLNLRVIYGIDHNFLQEFYIPALGCAVSYDRSVAYFHSQGLAGAAAGLARFIQSQGTMRLMVSPHNWDSRDIQAIRGNLRVPDELAHRLAQSLVPEDEIQAQRLSVIAWLVREGRLETKILIGPEGNLYHQKIGILRDASGDGVAFTGSNNETVSGWEQNGENLRTDSSWKDENQKASFGHYASEFERLWNNHHSFRAIPFPEAFTQELLKLAPDSPPLHVDPPSPRPIPTFTLFPHQKEGVDYLLDAYPQSRLLADEVGLGKTITAGGALMHLLSTEACHRALILAPANVCIQWQEELAQKFRYECPRLHLGGIYLPDGSGTPLDNANPFETHAVLIASSHLIRRPDWRSKLEAARKYDLIILDEAHHARRASPESDLTKNRQRPNQLLRLLEETLSRQARCLWLLTATPIQLHLVELYDLLRPLMPASEPDTSPLKSWQAFEAFYRACIAPPEQQDWNELGRGIGSVAYRLGDDMRSKLNPADRKRLQDFGHPGRSANADATNLCQAGHRDLLMQSVRERAPSGRLMLRRTRQQTGMAARFAKRIPSKVEIVFASSEERNLYEELDDFLLRLLRQKEGKPRGFGFMLATYRKRLTSSWMAVNKTIQRALREIDVPRDEIEFMEWGLDLAQVEDDNVADATYAGFTAADLADLRVFSERVERMADGQYDPKIQQLQADIDRFRAQDVSVLLFTQFVDTLHYLRNYLLGPYQEQVACYTGAGGQIWQNNEWKSVSKEDLTRAFAQGSIALLLCTDAASEGLNLQTASTIINYDLPWNPMRVEQRIGRIDRINQQAETLDILNYVLQDTIEDRVYATLEQRIGIFEGAVGSTQPILGRIEDELADASRDQAAVRLETLCAQFGGGGDLIAAALN